MHEFDRTSEFAAAALQRQHEEALRADPTVAPIGSPYWTGTKLISTVGLLGASERQQEAAQSREPGLLVLMARDPNVAVRSAVKENSATPRIIRKALSQTGSYSLDDAEEIWLNVWATDPDEVFHSFGITNVDAVRDGFEQQDAGIVRFVQMLASRGFMAQDYADEARARVWFESAAVLGWSDALRMIGVSYETEGNTAEAITWLTRAIPTSTKAWVDLGRVYASVGDTAQARKYLAPAAAGGDNEANRILASIKSGNCYIATAVYGSYDADPVQTLREFRDSKLVTTAGGRAFVRIYYVVSPVMARYVGRFQVLSYVTRVVLDRVVNALETNGYGNANLNVSPTLHPVGDEMPRL